MGRRSVFPPIKRRAKSGKSMAKIWETTILFCLAIDSLYSWMKYAYSNVLSKIGDNGTLPSLSGEV